MSDIISGWVRVVVEYDGQERVLGQSHWWQGRAETAAEVAEAVLQAWDEARDRAERTLRLYGAEGVLRALGPLEIGEQT